MKFRLLFKIIFAALLASILWSCSTTLDEYQASEPEFNLKDYFTGELRGWGYVKNYNGKVIERFSVDLEGTWEGNNGVLYELFKYADGRTQERTWYLEDLGNGNSKGTANDVIGTAFGKQNGFAFTWNYTLNIETDDGNMNVRLNDWLYQIDNQVVASQSDIRKFGIKVGEVVLFMIKNNQT